jgi:hypothetical protein
VYDSTLLHSHTNTTPTPVLRFRVVLKGIKGKIPKEDPARMKERALSI